MPEDAASVLAGDIINEEVALTTPVAQSESTRSYFLAQTLESTRTVPIVSASLPLGTPTEGEGAEGEAILPVSSTVVGAFEHRGITYAVEPGGESVAIVAADYAKLPQEYIDAQAIVLPSTVTPDGIDSYSVTRIADHAFANCNSDDEPITAITIPASVTSIEDDAFTGFDTLRYLIVSADNSNYAMYDGCLYDKPLKSLLLIPGGKRGQVRIPSQVEEIRPEAFSHCAFVTAFSADAACSLLTSGNDLEYTNANGDPIEIVLAEEGVTPLQAEYTAVLHLETADEQSLAQVIEKETGLSSEEAYTLARSEDGAFDGETLLVRTQDNRFWVLTIECGDQMPSAVYSATMTGGPTEDAFIASRSLQYGTYDKSPYIILKNASTIKDIYFGEKHLELALPESTFPYDYFAKDNQVKCSTKLAPGETKRVEFPNYSWDLHHQFIRYVGNVGLCGAYYFADTTAPKWIAKTYAFNFEKDEPGLHISRIYNTNDMSTPLSYYQALAWEETYAVTSLGGNCTLHWWADWDASTYGASFKDVVRPNGSVAADVGWLTTKKKLRTCVSNNTIDVPAESSLNIPAGTYFKGWATQEGIEQGKYLKYEDGTGRNVTVNADTTFYAVLGIDMKWNVFTYGGRFADNSTADKTGEVLVNTEVDIPAVANLGEGWTFRGWIRKGTTPPAAGSPSYYTGSKLTVTADMANGLEAVWGVNVKWLIDQSSGPVDSSVTFTSPAGASGTEYAQSNVLYGTQPLSAWPEVSSRKGCTLEGWMVRSGSVDSTAGGVPKVKSPTVFATAWTENVYSIAWNIGDHGTEPANLKRSYKYADADYTLPTPDRVPGWTFLGWYDNESCTGTAVTVLPTHSTGNKTFWAKWTEDSYAIEWKMQDHGSVPAGAKTSYKYDDADYTLPEPTHVPGWTFQGWYDNEGHTGSAVISIPHNSEGNRTFWAKWSQDDYTVTFDLTPQDGRPQAVQPSALPVLTWHYGEDLTQVEFPISSRDGGFYRNGYAFDGWFLKDGSSYAKVYDAASGRGVGTYERENDAILYALWTPIRYIVNFDWNYEGGGTYTYEVAYDDELSFTKGELDNERNLDYKLTGWKTVDGNELTFANGKAHFAPVFSSTAPSGGITYLAQWQAPAPIAIVMHTGPHAAFSNGAKERTDSLDYSKAVNLRDPKLGLDPVCDAGYDFICWRKAVLDADGNPVLDENGSYVVDEGSNITTVGPYATEDLHLVAYVSANECSVTLLPGADTDGEAALRQDVTYEDWGYMGDVYEFDISDFTDEDGAVSLLVLPNATRPGYSFEGWRLSGSKDKPVVSLSIDPTEIATSNTRNRVYEAVWNPKNFTVVFVSNRDDLTEAQKKEEEQKEPVSLKGSVTMPYPATRGEGDITTAKGKASSVFCGWTLSRTPSLSDDVHDAKTTVPIKDIASCASDDDTIVFYAQWNKAISVTCPLVATIAIDPENKDIVASENMALESRGSADLEVMSVRYDKLNKDQTSIFDETLVTSGVFDKGKVYLTVYAGTDKPNLAHDAVRTTPSLKIDLGSRGLIIPKDAVDSDIQTLKGASGFDKRFAAGGDSLSLYYGLEFGQGVDPRAFVDTLPDNDAGGANGWSSQSYPIARIYYTVGLA